MRDFFMVKYTNESKRTPESEFKISNSGYDYSGRSGNGQFG